MTTDDNEFDWCACGHARDEHKATGFTRGCLVEGCGCLDFERAPDEEKSDERS